MQYLGQQKYCGLFGGCFLNENLKLKGVLNVRFASFCLFWHGIAPFWLVFLERKFEIEKLSKVHNVVIFLLSQSMEFDKIL
jgi:hypothetical protein